MSVIPYIVAALVAIVAIGFVAWPIFSGPRGAAQNSAPVSVRRSRTARWLLAAAAALFVLGIGGGTYWIVGRPYLALRAGEGLKTHDVNALAPMLIARLRAHPEDEQGWVYLAQVYLMAGDAADAADAYGRAVALERKHGRPSAALESAYGEALVAAGGGSVSATAEAAFTAALAADPKSAPGRYYLGIAHAARGDRAGAARFWQGLLDDVPATSPLHQTLVDRLAAIGAAPPGMRGPGGAPDIGAMVAGLAARLKANPHDPAGWIRLIRAYSVLGDTAKAKAALATARKTVGADMTVKAALDSEASDLKLD